MNIFLKVSSEIRRVSENNVFPISSPQIMLRGHIFDAIAQIVLRTAVFQTFEKLCESNNFVIEDYSSTLAAVINTVELEDIGCL